MSIASASFIKLLAVRVGVIDWKKTTRRVQGSFFFQDAFFIQWKIFRFARIIRSKYHL